ncbi:adenylate/guanylate cyclase domain-containing protein [Actinomadura sp. WMMB 499]|uniref:effector-associated domain 2-containing protein n=1 Tax=Actinomadura sp. WMMB 499 TaxID=1219491 RepID=UPI0012480059|nr:adenylate/guanylate cyclase domain-containing protein [Actinomadura sp. WMMB 499]QFG24985.1 hypothetical protein F7P10_31480 [Actinomadura sp. WMMB 499]
MSVGEPGQGRWTPRGACSILACDIVAFGDTARTDDVREIMRDAMYRQIAVGLRAAGVGSADCYTEDRGDGAMVLVPPHVGIEALLTSVVDTLKAELRRYNKAAADVARIRLRVAVHTGEARYDGKGVVGVAVNHAFRILDAQPFKDALNAARAPLGVIVSQRVHDDVVRHGPGLVDPDDYRPIDIAVKETESTAWVRVLGRMPETGSSPDGTLVSTPDGAVEPASGPSAAATATVFPEPAMSAPAIPEPVPPSVLFGVTDQMVRLPLMTSERGRDQVVGALRADLRGAIPRHAEARMDVYSIIETCLDYPGGLHDLLATIKGFTGESMPVTRLEQAIARLLPRI